MDQQQATCIADRFIAGLHRIVQDGAEAVGTLVESLTDHAALISPLLQRHAAACIGRDQIESFWREYCASFANMHAEFYEVTTSDHAAGLFWGSSGNDARDQPLAYEGVSLLELDEAAKIAGFTGFFDSRQLMMKMPDAVR